MLKLVVDPIDRPELYDFLLFTSGVVRAEEGVRDGLRGIIEGDRDSARIFNEGGGGGGGGGSVASTFQLCDLGIVDNRLILLVSVGLMVRAPRPVA